MAGTSEQNAYLKKHFDLDVDSYEPPGDAAASSRPGEPDAPASGVPPDQPVSAVQAPNPKHFYDVGFQQGTDGADQICPDTSDESEEKAYEQGYGAGQVNRKKLSLTARIKGDIGDQANLKKDAAELVDMKMDTVLDVLTQLQKANALEEFAGVTAGNQPRIAGATYTVQGNYGEQWRQIVPSLSRPDQVAILKRTPKELDITPVAPLKAEDDDGVDSSVQTNEGTKLESIATLTLFDGLTKNKLFAVDFEVHVGAKGQLTSFEQDLKIFERSMDARLAGIPFEITGAFEVNHSMEFDTDEHRKITIQKVDTKLKASVELAVKNAGNNPAKVRIEASKGEQDKAVKWELVFEVGF